MNRILDTFTLGAVVCAIALGGCGGADTSGNGQPVSDAQVTAAVQASARELEPESATETDQVRVSRFMYVLNELRTQPALAPLFDAYQVKNPVVVEDDVRSMGLIDLLRSVQITISSGTLTITNRQTGDVIFTAPLSDLASGTFDPENLPGATGGTPPPPAACTYAYSAWGACQADGTQSRTVVSTMPMGCTGTPVLTQPCTDAPPLDGAALYTQYCSSCHGPLATSSLKGKSISVSLVKSRGMMQGLTDAQLQAIVSAVGP